MTAALHELESEPARTVRSLSSGFVTALGRDPTRPALDVEGVALSYQELGERASSLAATLTRWTPDGGPPLTAVFASRSTVAFGGVLAALFRGHGYVPLNRTFPPARTKSMLERAGCRAVVVDRGSAEQLDEVLPGEPGLLVVLPELDDVRSFRARWPMHRILGARDLEPPEQLEPGSVTADALAYLLFTSGSTGTPKGVAVAQRNVNAFVAAAVERYGVTAADRLSQTFDLTFDLSAFDMFVAWERGACLCCPSPKALIKPGGFIRGANLSIWFSVPSTAVFMKRLGALKPDSYPGLRWSLFCGEPLPVDVAEAWAAAAPNSVVENLYGPTELTIACTVYRWDPASSPAEAELGIVPIGSPLPRMRPRVADAELREVEPGREGELLVTGPQLTLGYWQDPEKTRTAFVVPPGETDVFYRTGDRVRRPPEGRPMTYLGRMDHQIKIRGYRVELGEVEAVLRAEAGIDAVVALGWPRTTSGAEGVVAFLGDDSVDLAALGPRLESRLPPYMVPRALRALPSLPLNSNGKFDRAALERMLEDE